MMKLMNLFQLLDVVAGGIDVTTDCKGLDFVIRIVKNGIFPIIQIGIPIILIVLGTFDLAKAVIASDEKEVKAAQGRLIKRCVYAIIIFFVVTLVSLVFNLVSGVAGDSAEGFGLWAECWKSV